MLWRRVQEEEVGGGGVLGAGCAPGGRVEGARGVVGAEGGGVGFGVEVAFEDFGPGGWGRGVCEVEFEALGGWVGC